MFVRNSFFHMYNNEMKLLQTKKIHSHTVCVIYITGVLWLQW